MSGISVKLSALENNKRQVNRLNGELERITDKLRVIRNSIDSDILSRNGIDRGLNDIISLLERDKNSLYKTVRFFDGTIKSYEDSERAIMNMNNNAMINGKTLFKNSNGNDVDGLIEDEGFVGDVLEYLPGGQKPTEEEIAQIDAILDKYERILAELYDDDVSDTDIKGILDALAKDLLPIVANHRYDFTWWYELVKPNGPLDVKNSRTITVNVNGVNKEVNIWNLPWSYNGQKYGEGDFAGNFLYGYLGAEVFGTGVLGQAILKGAAGAAQFLSDRNNPIINDPLKKYLESLRNGGWGDNEGDSNQIQLGIDSYISDHGSWKKVFDIGKFFNPFRPPIIYIPPVIVPKENEFNSEVFVEDEPGFKRDMELIGLMTGSAIETFSTEIVLPGLAEVADKLNKGINNLVQWASDTVNNAKEFLEDNADFLKDVPKGTVDLLKDMGAGVVEMVEDMNGIVYISNTMEKVKIKPGKIGKKMKNIFD